jgi:type IV pilus assembly protein PilW
MTLIEIMISLLIGVFLIGGVLQIFINTRQTYRMQENLSGMQENGRFALSFFSNDMRMADFRECPTSPSVATAVAGTNDAGLNGSDTITVTWQDSACFIIIENSFESWGHWHPQRHLGYHPN